MGEGPHSAIARAARERKVLKLRSPFMKAGESRGSMGELGRGVRIGRAIEAALKVEAPGELEAGFRSPSISNIGGGR